MNLPESYIPILRECSRDEASFQRLLSIMESSFNTQINFYREIAKNFPNGGMVVVDESLKHLVADGQSFTYQGLSHEMLEGRTLDELLPSEKVAELKPIFEAALNGEMIVKELAFGNRVNQFHTIPLQQQYDASPLGMVIGVDITHLRQAQVIQKYTQHFLDHVMTVFPYALYVYDVIEKHIIFVNRENWLNSGEIRSVEDEFFTSIIYPDDIDRLRANRRRFSSLADGEAIETEYRIRDQEGEIRWLKSRDKVLKRDADGRVIQILGAIEDITVGKQLNLDIQQKHSQLENFFEAALDLWCVADIDGYFLKLNRIWQETLGYSMNELVGQRFLDFVHPDDLQATLDVISLLFHQTPILNFTNRYRCKDGSYRFIEWRARPQGNYIYATARDITERKELEFYHSHLAAIVDSSGDGIIGKALDDTITSWNRAAEVMYGYTAEEMMGKTMLKLTPPDYHHELIINLDKVKRDGVTTRYETVRLHKDGTRVDVALTISPIQNKNGEIIGISTINQNITELKKAGYALQDSEARYRAVVTSMTEGIVLQRPDGMIEMCNSAAEEILGLSVDQMIGRTSVDPRWRTVHEDFTPFPGETHPAMIALKTGQSVSNVVMGVYKVDDTLTWILINSRPLFRHNSAKPYAAVTSFTDITLVRLTELALQQSEARLRSIVETIDDAVWSAELPTLHMNYFSPSANAILGRTAEDFYKDSSLLFRMIHADDYLLVKDAYANILNDERLDIEFRILRPDGQVRWVRNRGRLVNDPYHQPMRIEGILSDITEHKLIQQRKLDLEIERERVQLLSDFITNTSHELRTPLAIIGTGVYLMTRMSDRQQRQAKSLLIEQQIGYLTTMIDQLHDMVQLDRLSHLNTVRINLDKLIKQLTVSYSSKKSSVALKTELAANMPMIMGNSDYIHQAIFHLLDNAVRFSPEGEDITIRSIVTDHEVIIEIQDEGPGIAPIYHNHIFERFYKVDSARTRNDSGLGMGLAFVKQIMTLHNGRVTLQSIVGNGTTFRLHFPRS